MNPSRPFILRPIATSLLMAAILLAGIVAYKQLPVSALPEVDYPVMQIVTFYPGASPSVVASAVTAPLERQLGEVPGLNQMLSTSSQGASIITLQFVLSLNIDVAEQEVQAAINAAQTFLPADLPLPPIYSKTNPADAPIMTLALTSKSMALQQVEDFADTRLAQKISQLSGVGAVTISGGQKPAVRIQANPTQLASYGLNLEDVHTALTATSLDQAKGSFDGPHQAYQIGANDQLLNAQDYEQVIVAYRNGAPVMLKDVANVVDGIENAQAGRLDESNAGRHREYSEAARRQYHPSRGSGESAASEAASDHTFLHRCRRPDRQNHYGSRFRFRRGIRIDVVHCAGRDGHFRLSAKCRCHIHSRRGRSVIACGYFRRHVSAWL